MTPPAPGTVISGGELVTLPQSLAAQTSSPGGWGAQAPAPGLFGPEVPNLDYQTRRNGWGYGWRDPEMAYAYQPNLRMVVDYLASRAAAVPLSAYRRNGEEREKLGDDTRIGQTLGEPYPGVGQSRFMFDLFLDALLWDRWCFVVGMHGPSGRTAWVRLPPWWWHYGPGLIGQRTIILDGLDGSPLDPATTVTDAGRGAGTSGVRTLGDTLAGLDTMTMYRNQVYRSGGRFTAVIERPADAPEWSDEAKGKFRRAWQAAWAGNGPEAGGTPILEDGMKLAEVSPFSPDDLQYVDGRIASLIEVCTFYHAAPELIGARPGTYSNMAAHRVALYQETLGPYMTPVEEAITIQAARPMMGGEQAVYTEFNIEAMMRGTFEEQAQVLQAAVGGPYLLRNEARTLFNRPPVEGGDDLIVPLNVTTGGLASPRDTAPPPFTSKGEKQTGGKTITTHRNRITAAVTAWYEAVAAEVLPQLHDPGPPEPVKSIPVLDWDGDRYAAALRDAIRPHTGQAAHTGVHRMLDRYATADVRREWSDDAMAPWLDSQANRQAVSTTASLHSRLIETLTQPDTHTLAKAVFTAAAGRAALVAGDLASGAYHLGQSDGAKVSGVKTKTWRVASDDPRPEHAAIDGETVGTFDSFSNGGRWPGDPNLPVEETAGCTCEMDWGT